MYTHPRITLLTALFSGLLLVQAAHADEDKKPPKLFNETGEMTVTLSGPWRTVERNSEDDKRYPSQLTYQNAQGNEQTLAVEVAPRGLTRRRECDFPPLKIHFNKEQVKGTEFRGNKSLKMVTYCDTNQKYEQYYVKEFLAYRIYNLITDYSFGVRPMVIEYKDTDNKNRTLKRFGFLIEDIDDVAKRLSLKELSVARIPYKKLDPDETGNFALFQYLIGNLDWAATGGPDDDGCCHNSKLIGVDDESVPIYAIPYDFDSSGLINAHYAAPPDGLRVRSIRQRLYRGFCPSNDTLPQSIRRFNENKDKIMALFQSNPHLTERTRNQTVSYIEGFFEIINDPKKFENYIIDKCRGQG